MKYTRILNAITQRPWAILREKGDVICQIVAARAHGVAATPDEIQAAIGAARQPAVRMDTGGSIAVLPVFGTIMHRGGMMADFSGGTTIEGTRKLLRQAQTDPNVSGIILEFDSPGGTVDGVPEFAAELAAASAGPKPIMGIANTMAASAAYWLMSQLSETAIVPSGLVGSVGVYLMHTDWSEWDAKTGIAVTYVQYGEHKTEGHPDAPLSDETIAHWQSQVDAVGRQFVSAVATGRGVSQKVVLERFGQGRVLMPVEALDAKMVDRIATLDEMIDRMAAKVKRSSRARAATGPAAIAAAEDATDQVCATCNGSGLKPERVMSDPQGQETCETCGGSGRTTPAEAAPAVDEAARDRDWVAAAVAHEEMLLELSAQE
jgi:signal peptide peptidase SppA